MIYLTNINLNQNELQNAVLQPLAVAPANPKLGQIYTDSSSSKIKWYNGTEWKTVGVVVESSSINGSIKVDGVEMNVYTLPAATTDTLGGIKIGAGFKISEDGSLIRDIHYYSVVRNDSETDNAAISRAINGDTPVEGDVCIIKTLISGNKYSFMGYVYDNSTWNAMDGNVDATNVILRSDIVTAGNYTQVGNITKGANATGSISAAGKSISDVLQAIFTKEMNPTKTEPSVSLSTPKIGAKEVGTKVSVDYSATLNAGSYAYGPATGITAKSWEITDSEGNSSTDASGTFAEITVGDNTNYKITAKATYDAGAIPVTNLGNEYPAAQIAAGSKSKVSGALTGYRSYFYGSKTTPIELNSANIRALTNSGKAVGTSQSFSMSIVEGAKQVIIAFPTSTGKTLSKVLDTGAFGTDIVGNFVKSTIDVEGANGYTAVSYDVYVYAPDAALGANTYDITIA